MRVPCTAMRSMQSVLKEMNPEYSLERLIKDEAAILWPLDGKSRLIRKDLLLEKIEDRRKNG